MGLNTMVKLFLCLRNVLSAILGGILKNLHHEYAFPAGGRKPANKSLIIHHLFILAINPTEYILGGY